MFVPRGKVAGSYGESQCLFVRAHAHRVELVDVCEQIAEWGAALGCALWRQRR